LAFYGCRRLNVSYVIKNPDNVTNFFNDKGLIDNSPEVRKYATNILKAMQDQKKWLEPVPTTVRSRKDIGVNINLDAKAEEFISAFVKEKVATRRYPGM